MMTDQIDLIDIRDIATHEGQVQSMRGSRQGVLKIVNGLDQDVTVTIEASTFEDDTFTDPYNRDTETVAAGAVGYVEVGESWQYVRPVAQCSSSPSSGTLKMVWDFK